MDRIDAVVIGAGVVGLAIGRALALAGKDVAVLEAADAFGTETSARNSEVIHAGIYYPKDSLKATLCVSGKEMLYRYCADRGVPHRRCGKLIVATDEAEVDGLAAIRDRAAANGVGDLTHLDAAAVRALEPSVSCKAALLSPTTGIVDSHGLMLSLLGDLENAGGFLALESPVERIARNGQGFVVETGGAAPMQLGADLIVNAAGHWAPPLARETAGFGESLIPQPHYCKGRYYMLSGARPFSRLIYPMPQQHGLGVHVTLDMAGSVRFGPDTVWLDHIDYTVEAEGAAQFYDAVRRYYPELEDDSLVPGYAGVRPKLAGPGAPAQDFAILGPEETGIAGHVALFGIESPGLTACLAIAEQVSSMLLTKA